MATRNRHGRRVLALAAALLGALAPAALAATYTCTVTDVWSPLALPKAEYLARTQPVLRLEDSTSGVVVTRCARDPASKEMRCRRIEIDWVFVNDSTGSRKFYRFADGYDLQLSSDLTFVENDGRGVVYHGRCKAAKK